MKLRNSVLLLSFKPKFLTLWLRLKRQGTGEVFNRINGDYPQRQKHVAHLLTLLRKHGGIFLASREME